MPAIDAFDGLQDGIISPASHAFAITPHATDELTQVTRAIYVGGEGDVELVLRGDTAAVVFSAVPAGTLLPVRAKRVVSTNTTATALVGIY